MKINEVIKNIDPKEFLNQKALLKDIAKDLVDIDQTTMEKVIALMEEIQLIAEESGMVFPKEEVALWEKFEELLPHYSRFADHEGTEYIVCQHFSNGVSAILNADMISVTMAFGKSNNYEQSNYRKFLNDQYLRKLEQQFGAENIIPHAVRLGSNRSVTDKVSIRTYDQYMRYINIKDGFCGIEPLATPKGERNVLLVWSDGRIKVRPCTHKYRIRPFFYVKTESLLPFICEETENEDTGKTEMNHTIHEDASSINSANTCFEYLINDKWNREVFHDGVSIEEIQKLNAYRAKTACFIDEEFLQDTYVTLTSDPATIDCSIHELYSSLLERGEYSIHESKPETITLKFQGRYDDTFGEYGETYQNIKNCAPEKPVQCIIDCKEYGRLMVVGQYSPNLSSGCWVIGVGKVEDTDAFPDWKMKLRDCPEFPCSMELEVEIPNCEFELGWYDNGNLVYKEEYNVNEENKPETLTLKFHNQSDDIFQYFDQIFAICNSLKPEERLNIEEFGSQHDLTLSIEKDSDYDVLTGENNLVDIVTIQHGIAVDDAVGIYVTDGQLLRELNRIYNYRNFSTL